MDIVILTPDIPFIFLFRKEFVSSFIEGRSRRTSESYDELALIFEVPTSYIGREVS